MKKIKISAVSYTNTLPFLQGIRNSDVINEIELSVDYPSECARKVIEDEVDMGIIPTAALAEMPEYHIIGDYCIGSKDYVNSVFIFSYKPVEEIKSLRLDHQSKTSNGLARVLLKHYWKRSDVKIMTEGPADAEVLIGDRTFGKVQDFPYVYDLGHYWNQLTGLPFAYALWVSKRELPQEFEEKFNKALAEGVSRTNDVIPGLPVFDGFDYDVYLNQQLDFHLDDKKREAVKQYLTWYKEL